MSKDKLLKMINEFFDGELSKDSEAYLFTQLSSDEESRTYFKNLNFIKSALNNSLEDFPDPLDEQILTSLSGRDEREFKLFRYDRKFNLLVYAVTIVLFCLSLFFFYSTNSYRSRLDNAIQRIDDQQRILLLLTNSLPTAEVSPKYDNEIIIDANL